MTYVCYHGRPDLFVTFTTNPKWKEVTSNIFANQSPKDRPDVIARVFHRKLNALMVCFTKFNIFGEVAAYVYSVEWQKRGLPHAHILLWLKSKLHGEDIDKLISAEIPNEDNDPELHQVVGSHMIHRPCEKLNTSAPCMKDGHCICRYPRDFVLKTQTNLDGYPLYQRRNLENGGYKCET